LIISVLVFAGVFFYLGTPVMHEGGVFGELEEVDGKQLLVTDSPELLFGYRPNVASGLPWYDNFGRASLQAIVLSLESISSLGFFWLSEFSYTWQNFWAAVECLWGVFLAAMFVWCVGRKLSAR
jgi:hypothetical protein